MKVLRCSMIKISANDTDSNKDGQNCLSASDTQLGSTNIMIRIQNRTKDKKQMT